MAPARDHMTRYSKYSCPISTNHQNHPEHTHFHTVLIQNCHLRLQMHSYNFWTSSLKSRCSQIFGVHKSLQVSWEPTCHRKTKRLIWRCQDVLPTTPMSDCPCARETGVWHSAVINRGECPVTCSGSHSDRGYFHWQRWHFTATIGKHL